MLGYGRNCRPPKDQPQDQTQGCSDIGTAQAVCYALFDAKLEWVEMCASTAAPTLDCKCTKAMSTLNMTCCLVLMGLSEAARALAACKAASTIR